MAGDRPGTDGGLSLERRPPIRWIRFFLTLTALWALLVGAGATTVAETAEPLWWGVRIGGGLTALSGVVTIAFRSTLAGEVARKRTEDRATDRRRSGRPTTRYVATGTARILMGIALVVATL